MLITVIMQCVEFDCKMNAYQDLVYKYNLPFFNKEYWVLQAWVKTTFKHTHYSDLGDIVFLYFANMNNYQAEVLLNILQQKLIKCILQKYKELWMNFSPKRKFFLITKLCEWILANSKSYEL